MSVHVLHAASRPVNQWRNGGGETSEIARRPSAAGEDWWWRASIATITQDGAFSPFPGCDRTLVPLDGSLRLDIAGTRTDVSRLEAVHFRGEDDVRAVDVTHRTTDLNIIVSRKRGTARLTMCTAPGTRYSPTPGQRLLVVALSDQVSTDAAPLARLDAALLEAGQEIFIERGLAAVITIADLS